MAVRASGVLAFLALLLAAVGLATVYPTRFSDSVEVHEQLAAKPGPNVQALANNSALSTGSNSTFTQQEEAIKLAMRKIVKEESAKKRASQMLHGLRGSVRRMHIRASEVEKQEQMDKARAKALGRAESSYTMQVKKLKAEIEQVNMTLLRRSNKAQRSKLAPSKKISAARKRLNFYDRYAREQSSVFSFWRKFGLQKAKEHHDQEIFQRLKKKAQQLKQRALHIQSKVNSTLEERTTQQHKIALASASASALQPKYKLMLAAERKARIAVKAASEKLNTAEDQNHTAVVDADVPTLLSTTQHYRHDRDGVAADATNLAAAAEAERTARALASGEKLIIQRLHKKLSRLSPQLATIPAKESALKAKIAAQANKSKMSEQQVHGAVQKMASIHYADADGAGLAQPSNEEGRRKQSQHKLITLQHRLAKERAQAAAMRSMNKLYEKRMRHSEDKISHIRHSLKNALKREAKARTFEISVARELEEQRSQLAQVQTDEKQGVTLGGGADTAELDEVPSPIVRRSADNPQRA